MTVHACSEVRVDKLANTLCGISIRQRALGQWEAVRSWRTIRVSHLSERITCHTCRRRLVAVSRP
jgi:hypothetical protein